MTSDLCHLKHTDILTSLSEYEVVSTSKGPNGEEVSVLTTNQTHTAVENLKPESKYVTQTLCLNGTCCLNLLFSFTLQFIRYT